MIEVLKLLYIRTASCPPTWTSYAHTNVHNGKWNPALSVRDCLAACETDVQCTGVDYVVHNPQGLRCWLSGPWSGRRNNGTMWGIVHYAIDRRCTGIEFSSFCAEHRLFTTVPVTLITAVFCASYIINQSIIFIRQSVQINT